MTDALIKWLLKLKVKNAERKVQAGKLKEEVLAKLVAAKLEAEEAIERFKKNVLR